VNTLRTNILTSLFLWLFISAAAWPAYVAANLAISYFVGEGSIIDLWNLEPKRNIVANFIEGYKASALLAIVIGLVAVVDYQILSRHRITGYIAGILLPVGCVALAFVFFPEPGYVLPGFALMGIALWIVYKFIDIGFRLRRVS